MKENGKVVELVSAGGVVYRRHGERIDVALCGRIRPKLWALPKGTPDAGETLEETALREVNEETGLQVSLEDTIDKIEYRFAGPDRVRCFKTVHFYLMSSNGGSMDDHDPEFDLVRWFDSEDALATLSYQNERNILSKARQMVLDQGK
ncbi:MAG: 8-oxo-dGTP pyrophosphatase MutT, NUDIX family [Chloroflexi bacterium]|nr:MAG: 8-oxo-dGTP pyrophosphatase MutT, NUDIX family [Chloroflexota bacterium]